MSPYPSRSDGVKSVSVVRHDDEQGVFEVSAVTQPLEEVSQVRVCGGHPRDVLVADLGQEREAEVGNTSGRVDGDELAHIIHLQKKKITQYYN